MNAKQDLLESGFQLAYLIFPDRPRAVRILGSAINKLKAQSGRESRRTYWRDKYLKRAITRISREEGDMLQWLILYESDPYEKEQEAAHQSTLKDMVLRYVKSLVRMTSNMSSFHVNIGLHRLLHNYSTKETQQVYESITERYLGADEYRRAKSVLMNKLEERFGAMLKTCRTHHGELRFESSDQQILWAGLVDICLNAFTPWSTFNECPVPVNFGGSDHKLPSRLSGEGASEADQNRIEMNRCHAFIDPACYGRLVRALSIEPRHNKLDLPRFFMENPESSNHSDPQPPPLSEDERKTVAGFVTDQANRRQKAVPKGLNVVVDGKECAQLDLARSTSRQFAIVEGAELMEIWTDDEGEPLLLATHRIAYSDATGMAPAKFTLRFHGGAELVLQISGSAEAAEGPRTAIVSLSYRPSTRSEAGLPRWLRTAPKFALASAALIALGWFLGVNARRPGFSGQPAAPEFSGKIQTRPQPTPTPLETAGAHQLPVIYRLVSDDLAIRGSGSSETPSVVVPLQPALLQLELPVSSTDVSKSFHAALKPLLKDEEILTGNRLRPHRTTSGEIIITFPIASTFLEANRDYVVELRYHLTTGGMADASSYTFHAVKAQSNR